MVDNADGTTAVRMRSAIAAQLQIPVAEVVVTTADNAQTLRIAVPTGLVASIDARALAQALNLSRVGVSTDAAADADKATTVAVTSVVVASASAAAVAWWVLYVRR